MTFLPPERGLGRGSECRWNRVKAQEIGTGQGTVWDTKEQESGVETTTRYRERVRRVVRGRTTSSRTKDWNHGLREWVGTE